MRIRKKGLKNNRHLLFILPIIFSLIGLFFVFEASSVNSFQKFGNSFYFFNHQLIWVFAGIIAMIFFSFLDYHNLYYLSFTFMLSTIVLLFAVLIPGIGHSAGGARRWINLGVFNLQPTELAKLSIIVYLSSWFTHRERKRFFSFLILLGLLMGLILLQPDMGTAMIVFLLSIFIYFFAGVDIGYLFFLIPSALLGFYFLVKISPYRLKRLTAFLHPNIDPLGISYHINQIFISLTNGGLFGQGFGASRQKYLFLPEAHTDSIFAIIGEEFGFIGGAMLIFFYLYLIRQLYNVIKNAPDRLGKLLAGAIFVLFNLQILINFAGMVALIPLTGVPLPFVSYGGSNIIVSFILIGILVNISKKGRR